MYGIIFDVDGVIADTEGVNAEASIKMFRGHFGLHNVQRSDFDEGIGKGAAAYVLAAARRHNRELTPQEVETATRIRQENILEILRRRPLPPLPGVTELMGAALACPDRFSVAIATSSAREISTAVLMAAGVPISRLVYVNGDEVTHKKPDPQLFLLAAKRMGLPEEVCVVVEDAPNGLQAARAAGMRCIAVTNSFPREKLLDADLVVGSLADVSLKTVLRLFS